MIHGVDNMYTEGNRGGKTGKLKMRDEDLVNEGREKSWFWIGDVLRRC